MEKQTFTIPNISCGHCVMTIKNELGGLEGVRLVEGDPAAKSITVGWDTPASVDKIRASLEDINFPAT